MEKTRAKLEGTCNAAQLTPDMCGAMCFSLGMAEHGQPYHLAGVEDANQCFCDNVRNPDYPQGHKRHPMSMCDMPCGGAPNLKCGGFKTIEIYTLQCTSNWGSAFIIILLICCALYTSGGLGYNIKVKGMELGLEALPNVAFWRAFIGLVTDGSVFSFQQLMLAVAKAQGTEHAAISKPLITTEKEQQGSLSTPLQATG